MLKLKPCCLKIIRLLKLDKKKYKKYAKLNN